MYLSCPVFALTYKIKLLLDIPAGSLLRTDVLPAVLLLLYHCKGNGNETTACALPTPAWLLFAIEEQGILLCIYMYY